MAADNKMLGQFDLVGIPPAPRGVPQIEVTFNIDANGILNVTAKDKGTGKEQSITIQGSGNLDKAEVEKAAKEAEVHAEEDKKKRETIEAQNSLQNAVYQAEKMKTDYKDKLGEEDVKTLDEAITEAKGHLEATDKDELEKAAKELSDKIMPVGAKMYEAASKDAAAESGEPKAESEDGKKKSGKDDPIEGEVVDPSTSSGQDDKKEEK
jgi:molecular chaperone DnaK